MQHSTNPKSRPRAGNSSADPSLHLAGRDRSLHERCATVDRERLQAAALLLGDPSRNVRCVLLREFRRAGRAGKPLLRSAGRSDDAAVRSHARALAGTLERDEVFRRLYGFAGQDELDLESAFFLLARLDVPQLDARPYKKALDAMAAEVNRRSAGFEDPFDACKVLVDYLAGSLGYSGEPDTELSPDDVFLHRLIERKRGLPLTLCALYTFVARRCGLHTGIVPLPGHVMLRLHGRSESLIVDPFNNGEIRTQESLMYYLAENGLRFEAMWFRDATDVQVFRRQISNLRSVYQSLQRTGSARRLGILLDQIGG